jgi:hypothetical protein
MFKPLIAGVDTLEIGYCVKSYLISDPEWDTIRIAKETAQATLHEKGFPITFKGKDFEVKRTGAQRYQYILDNDDIQIKLFDDARSGISFPELRITLSSAFLWRETWKEAVKIVNDWINTWALVSVIKISRIDINVDFAGEMPTFTPEYQEVVGRCRTKKETGELNTIVNGKRISTYYFGTKNLMCRIYNKSLEIKKSNKGWFEILWEKHGWQKGETVVRVEFQCRRKIIREFQINTLEDLFAQVPDLWRYLANDWLSVRTIESDTHRDRWETAEYWKIVQSAVDRFGDLTGVTRLKQVKPRYERLEKQARGIAISMAALTAVSMGQPNVKYGLGILKVMVKKWEKDSEFQIEVEARIKKFGTMK